MDRGLDGLDDNPITPLARSIASLLEDGEPFISLVQCFLEESKSYNISQNVRWFGIFIYSAGKRVLFYPGFDKLRNHILGIRNDQVRWDKDFLVDHFSLEKSLDTWHLTSPASKEHLGNPKTFPLGDGRYLWLGISFRNFDAFLPTKKETQIISKAPEKDSKRRIGVFKKARENSIFQIFRFYENHDFLEYFYHIAIIVGPKDFEIYKGEILGFPINSPFLAKPLPDNKQRLPIRIHRLSLPDNFDIQITTALVPGQLNIPITITSPST
jgi:hypothetical protein